MNCIKIESILSLLKVNSIGKIRNKGKVIDQIHSEHLKTLDLNLNNIDKKIKALKIKIKDKDVINIDQLFNEINQIIYSEKTMSKFRIGSKVSCIDDEYGKIKGEVTDMTSESIFIKWNDITEPVEHLITSDIKLVKY